MSDLLLQPRSDTPPSVTIELEDAVPTDQEVESGFKELGLIKVSATKVRHYRQLGVHLKRQGVIHTQRGQAFMTQYVLADTMNQLHKLLSDGLGEEDKKKKLDVEEACAIAREISHAASKYTESQEFSLKLENLGPPSVPPPDLPSTPTNVFPAGAVVAGGNATVHYHPPGDSAPLKPVATPPPAT